MVKRQRYRYLFILISTVIMLLAMSQSSFADDGWNVESFRFIPVSHDVNMSQIYERDNDGIYGLNLVNRGKNSSFDQCFFMKGDKCVVTYKDGTTKEFIHEKNRGVSYADFIAEDGEVIQIEGLTTAIAREIKDSREGSADEMAAVIGDNNILRLECGKYTDDGMLVGRVFDECRFNVVRDMEHNDCKASLRGRSKNDAACEINGMAMDCQYCQVCGKYYLDADAKQEVSKEKVFIPMLGHDYSNSKWTTVKEATEKAAGLRSRKCARCEETETKVIPQLKPTLPKVTILKPEGAKKSATVKWKKVSKKDLKKIKKIQISYSMDRGFSTGVKSISVSAEKTSKKLTKLKTGKTYYIRIRALNGKHASAWSNVKAVKMK